MLETGADKSRASRAWEGLLGDLVVAVGLALAAYFCRLLIDPLLGDRQPFLFVYPAILAVALARGWVPAVLALLLAGLACWYSFVAAKDSFVVATIADGLQLAAAALVSLVIIALTEIGRRAQARARRAVRDLHAGEMALAESRGLSRAILEAATEFAIFVTDPSGRVLTWNPGARAIFGYDDHEIVGRDARALFTPEDREARAPELEMRTAAERGRSEDERWHLRKDGTRFWASGALMPIRGAAGEVTGFLKIARDATEQRRAREELERRAQELARSNADLEEFAYIASHDLKEPIRGISNYASFILEDHAGELPQGARDRLAAMRRLCARMDSLLNSLLEYSRAGRITLEMETCDLNELIDEVLDSLRPWMESFSARVTVQPGLPRAPCDRHRLAQVFSNLITNAVKYNTRDERTVEIGAAPPLEPGGPSVFFVRDNGIGIEARHAAGIFSMFKRLHGRDQFGGGAGAGLTIVRKIVERHGGRVWVESTPGQGSTFLFTLSPAPAEAGPPRPRPRAVPGRADGEPEQPEPADAPRARPARERAE